MYQIITLFGGYLLGMFVFAFTIIQVLIILFFAIPTTNKLQVLGLLQEQNPIKKRHLISVALLLSIFTGISFVIYYFAHRLLIGYVIGVGLTFFLSLGKIGATKSNISDYLETNKKYLLTDDLVAVVKCIINE